MVGLSRTFNPAQPAAGVELCRLDEIADPGGKGFDFREGEAIFMGFVVRQGERALGYVDSCPHAGFAHDLLHEGRQPFLMPARHRLAESGQHSAVADHRRRTGAGRGVEGEHDHAVRTTPSSPTLTAHASNDSSAQGPARQKPSSMRNMAP